jgi:5-methylcytosine-specific restriction enzyme subunit McrC
MIPGKRASVLRENDWYLLSNIIDTDIAKGGRLSWRREVQAKSEQIKRDLGLRYTPLTLDDREAGLSLRASGIAGSLYLFDSCLQIAPKFVGTEDLIENWQTSVLSMLDRVRRKQYTYSRVKGVSLQKATFIDHVALAYVDAIEKALREEPIQVYRIREETSPYLRGRFAVGRQMQSILDRPHLIHCEVDYLETDNQYNHLLHWAGNRFITLVFDSQVRRQLTATLEKLPRITLPAKIPMHLPVTIPPQFKHYSEAINIASVLAKGYGHGQETGRLAGYGYVLNMERLFESFVERSLDHVVRRKDVSSYVLRPQATRIYAEALEKGLKSYYTRPDNVLYKDNQAVLLVDAKYKNLSEADEGSKQRPQNSDIYQLFASLVSHQCGWGLLLYPRMLNEAQSEDSRLKIWKVVAAGQTYVIGASTVNISNLSSKMSLNIFDQQLDSTIQQLLSTAA